jgi:putative transposon-encoded protein
MRKKVAEKRDEIGTEEYEVKEKTAMQRATSAKVLVPKRWIGKSWGQSGSNRRTMGKKRSIVGLPDRLLPS